MGTSTDRITATQYFLSGHEGDRTQLIDGVMVVNGPLFLHGVVQLRIAEVRSPGTWRFDVGRKRDTYEAGGLPELWLVDTQAEVVTAHRRSAPGCPTFDVEEAVGADGQLTSPLLAGFALDLAKLFARG